MTEISERLRTIRECRHLSRAQLARECGRNRITERQIARIESGTIGTPRQNTVNALADGLRVEVGELTGDLPFPEYVRSGSRPMEVGDTFPVGGRFRPELRLAFDLIRHRYGWDEQRVIALAPLMFVLLVERCIGWQKQRLADLDEQLERFDRQISSRIKAVVHRDEALKDIPTGQDQPLPEHFHRTFGEYLRALAADLPPASPSRWSRSCGAAPRDASARSTSTASRTARLSPDGRWNTATRAWTTSRRRCAPMKRRVSAPNGSKAA